MVTIKVGDWVTAFNDQVSEAERQRWDEWVWRHMREDIGDGGGWIPMVFELPDEVRKY